MKVNLFNKMDNYAKINSTSFLNFNFNVVAEDIKN